MARDFWHAQIECPYTRWSNLLSTSWIWKPQIQSVLSYLLVDFIHILLVILTGNSWQHIRDKYSGLLTDLLQVKSQSALPNSKDCKLSLDCSKHSNSRWRLHQYTNKVCLSRNVDPEAILHYKTTVRHLYSIQSFIQCDSN